MSSKIMWREPSRAYEWWNKGGDGLLSFAMIMVMTDALADAAVFLKVVVVYGTDCRLLCTEKLIEMSVLPVHCVPCPSVPSSLLLLLLFGR
jgi:hypothetical protein